MVSIGTAISETWDERGTVPMALLCGLFAGLGGVFANVVLPHVVESTVVHAVFGGLIAGGAVIVGVAAVSLYIYER